MLTMMVVIDNGNDVMWRGWGVGRDGDVDGEMIVVIGDDGDSDL